MAKVKFNPFIYRGLNTMSEEQANEEAAWRLHDEYVRTQKAKRANYKPDLSKVTVKAQKPKTVIDPRTNVIAYAPKVIDLTVEQVKEALFAIEEDNGDKIVAIKYDEAHRGALEIAITFQNLREIVHYELSKGTRPSDKNYVRIDY